MQQFINQLPLENIFTVPDLQQFLVNTVLVLILAQILAYIYRKFGQTLSNRKKLSTLFPLLAITTMMIISIIRTSIALSLGLVGALSIVRFRSAIKEPEELAYIFLTISLGLGMGSGQRDVTLGFFAIAILFIVGRALLSGKLEFPGVNNDERVYLEIISNSGENNLDNLSNLISPFTSGLELKRMDTSNNRAEYYFLAWIPSYQELTKLTKEIKKAEPEAEVSILNEDTLFS